MNSNLAVKHQSATTTFHIRAIYTGNTCGLVYDTDNQRANFDLCFIHSEIYAAHASITTVMIQLTQNDASPSSCSL